MAITITGSHLMIKDVVDVARNREEIELHPDALERIKKCRKMLEQKIAAREIMYGVNTGIGEFSEVVLDDEQIKTELNGVGDNPIFIPEDEITLTGANFQGTPVSLPMDMVSAAVTMVCVISERRFNRLNNPALSAGLPAFLTKGAGMFSGLMLSQYTADSLIVEQRILSMPASMMSIPAAADQEDFVSMGMNTAIKNTQILDNAYGILGIEFMGAAQALDFRDHKPGKGVRVAIEVIRKYVDHLDIDRPLYTDHTRMKEVVKSCEVLEAVEEAVGSLG
ncbi:aromatic amino acid lyase [candidate division KSB1 bacterium]